MTQCHDDDDDDADADDDAEMSGGLATHLCYLERLLANLGTLISGKWT